MGHTELGEKGMNGWSARLAIEGMLFELTKESEGAECKVCPYRDTIHIHWSSPVGSHAHSQNHAHQGGASSVGQEWSSSVGVFPDNSGCPAAHQSRHTCTAAYIIPSP